ncbi:hypothetical protein ABPG74_002973 [Tetrahymena malaccensis]
MVLVSFQKTTNEIYAQIEKPNLVLQNVHQIYKKSNLLQKTLSFESLSQQIKKIEKRIKTRFSSPVIRHYKNQRRTELILKLIQSQTFSGCSITGKQILQ